MNSQSKFKNHRRLYKLFTEISSQAQCIALKISISRIHFQSSLHFRKLPLNSPCFFIYFTESLIQLGSISIQFYGNSLYITCHALALLSARKNTPFEGFSLVSLLVYIKIRCYFYLAKGLYTFPVVGDLYL